MVYELYPNICLLCEVGYAHCNGLRIWHIFYVIIVHNLMHYSNKCQLFYTREQSADDKRSGMVGDSLKL